MPLKTTAPQEKQENFRKGRTCSEPFSFQWRFQEPMKVSSLKVNRKAVPQYRKSSDHDQEYT